MIPRINESKEEFQDVDLTVNNDNKQSIKWHRQLLLSKPIKISLVILLVAVVAPVLLYQFFYFATADLEAPDGFSLGSCLVSRSSRLPCGLGDVTAQECHAQCCYDFSSDQCFHRFPSRFSFIMNWGWTEDTVMRPRIATVPFDSQNSLTSLRLSIDEVSPTHLTLTYYDSTKASLTGRRIIDKEYVYVVEAPELNIIVNASNHVIFDTLRGPLIASEDIWELAFKLTEENLYGLGEIPIREGMTKVIYNRKGDLSSIPLIFAKSNDSYHGLLIDVPEPTEVSFRTDHRIVLRSINNFGLKLHLFVGPKPADIMKDVMKLMKYENKLEYWMLGTHFCSESSEEVPNINSFIQEASRFSMPVDSHCVTPIVFTNECDKEFDSVLVQGASVLHSAGKRFVKHVSPHIVYEEHYDSTTTIDPENVTEATTEAGTTVYTDTTPFTETPLPTTTLQDDTRCLHDFQEFSHLFILDSNSSDFYKGLVNGNTVLYPVYGIESNAFADYFLNHTADYDGLVLENSWPIDETDKSVNKTHLYLPYFSKNFENAFLSTPQWNATINDERYLYNANQYGNYFTEAIQRVKSVPTWASSQWMNNNIYINRQNIDTSWTNLNKELIQAALGGISGHWLWSTPICGDTDNFDVDNHSSLCLKWYLAATYFPMIKIHSRESLREPDAFSATFRTLMINALRTRISLAPYFYTTLQEGPLLRPMFYQFPDVAAFKDMTSQFGVGDSLVIVPNLHPRQSVVHFWKPPGIWFEMWSGLEIKGKELGAVTVATTDFDLATFIMGGSIIVMQNDVKLTADRTRSESNLSLKIALSCYRTNNTRMKNDNTTNNFTDCNADGTLFMDRNMIIHFSTTADNLKIHLVGDFEAFCNETETENTWANKIDEIDIYGLDDEFNNYDHKKNVKVEIDLCEFDENFEILFNFLETPSEPTTVGPEGDGETGIYSTANIITTLIP